MKSLVIAVDVGTTNVRAHVVDKQGYVVGKASEKLIVEQPKPGWAEIDHEKLWCQFQTVVKDSIKDAGIQAHDVAALGITTQRNTFITWNKRTGKPLHNFICWYDLRCADLCRQWNNSYRMKGLNFVSGALHLVTRSKRFLAGRVIEFYPKMVTMRYVWVLQNIYEVAMLAAEGLLLFGTIDTWLLWKLSKGTLHATDYSNASSTGMFDPYTLKWNSFIMGMVGVPIDTLPNVRDTYGEFCTCPPELFGSPIPVTAVVADQQSAMFAQCCWSPGDVKITLGTGMFFDVNTGDRAHASLTGFLPLIGWKVGTELVYLAEGQSSDSGITLEWGQRAGLYSSPAETAAVAQSVEDSGGICVFPAFNGFLVPINDSKACGAIMGLTLTTSREQICRAFLESIAYRTHQLYSTAQRETQCNSLMIKVDGGVSNNNFIVQLISDLIGVKIQRSHQIDMTVLGAAYMAGLASGVWASRDEVQNLQQIECVFQPRELSRSQLMSQRRWLAALPRCLNWYS
ncbi:putative glycerol kinase 5 isoform X2 [Corticium candelabrum]|uniref:putative glycerol kinase 5 isoform X2 n=1 Tax=Corticium candelabrum TaxID=121492 RepID=UPI002E273DBA|nr:putative glycerol kinase 5 isoform X2 [Corticium candelabrum]